MEPDLKRHLDAFALNSVDLISREELSEKLRLSLAAGKPLKLKIGFDPTARDIHLGHTVLLRKLRTLQDLGHEVHLIIGDFTAKIGDPSGKSALRPVLSDEQIKDNAVTYTDQAFKVLDRSKTKIIFNGTWYRSMPLDKFLGLLSHYTMARILERDDFSNRLKEGKPLSMLEVVYPLVQGYDSVCLEADVEFGGTDQKFNLLVGRGLQEAFGQKPQCVVTMPILVGLDGKDKMSKSLGNYIGVNDAPGEMFGKVMSVSDTTMWEYYRLLADSDIEEAKKLHPKEAKLRLAAELVRLYHDEAAAQSARGEFERVFSQRGIPADMPVYQAGGKIFDLVKVMFDLKLVSSKNEARSLLRQEAVSFAESGRKITEDEAKCFSVGIHTQVLKIGKRTFLKITP